MSTTIPFTHLDTSPLTLNDPTLELQAITVTLNSSQLHIFNVYIPPASSCPRLYTPDLAPVLNFTNDDAIIVGDFNAHHGGWHSSLNDARGESLADIFDNSPFCIINADSPTCLPTNGSPSSPDITLISAHHASAVSWTTMTCLNSDHLPILIDFLDDFQDSSLRPRTFTNFRWANWPGYIRESEDLFAALPPPTSCAVGERKFREVLLTVSKHNIPAGYRKNFISGLPTEARDLIQ